MVESSGGLGLGVTPIGPTWDIHHYFLGADNQGRDVAARMLYGGRNSLIIGTASAALCCFFATIIALIAGFFGGITDQILSRVLDVIWAFPVFLAAISISTVALTSGIPIGPITLERRQSLAADPHHQRDLRARTSRGRSAARCSRCARRSSSRPRSASVRATWRLIFSEVLPNVITTVIVFFPLMIATNMLIESALSFLSIGVQPPDASWGTIISDGQGLLYTRPWVAIAPGPRDRGDRALPERARRRRARCARSPRAPEGRPPVMRASSSAGCIGALLVMFALSVLVFLIFFATPGVDPAARIAGRNADPGDAQAGAPRLRPRPAAARAVR